MIHDEDILIDDPSRASRGQVVLDDDGIARVTYPPTMEVTLAIAHHHVAWIDRISGGTALPVCVDMTHVRNITKEARKFFVSVEATRNVSASALVVESSISRLLGNFFMGINKPQIPTKLFTSEADAIAWLKVFLP